MGWSLRFWKRIKLNRFVTLNLSKRGASVTFRVLGRPITIGRSGVTATVSKDGASAQYRLPWKDLYSGSGGTSKPKRRKRKRKR